MAITRIRRAMQRRLGDDRERGMSLIEMLFSIFIFGMFIVMFMSAVVQMSRTSSNSIARSSSASGALVSFLDLDRTVRWADSINPPGVSNGDAWVEFHISSAASLTGVETCVQWRFDPTDSVIQERSWNAATGAAISGWGTRSTNVRGTPTSTYPFKFEASTSANPQQRLLLSVVAGGLTSDAQTEIQTSYVARNSSARSTNPICNPTGYRS